MKRLLILGGIASSIEIVDQAHKMGIEVYVTDYLADSPAKVFADKSFMVSATDVEAVVDLIKQERIDGVLTGYVDMLLPYYVQICNKANLPCYATGEQVAITTDKARFKALCKQFSVPTVPEYTYEDVVSGKAEYPILVKPVDNSGARGIYICRNMEEFEYNYKTALSYSSSKHVLIERYMTGKEATIFYYIHEGKIYLEGIGNRHMLRFDKHLLPLPIGYTFPSSIVPYFVETEHQSIVKMFESIGIKEGMIFMQAFVEGDKCVIYEMGYRLTGSREHHLINHACGFNPLAAMIDYAVGNTIDKDSLKCIDPLKGYLANVTLLLKEGVIAGYEGIDMVKNMQGVLHVSLSYGVGKEISGKIMGTLAQAGVRVLLWADSKENLVCLMDKVKNTIKVRGENGEDLLIDDYSYSLMVEGSDIH